MFGLSKIFWLVGTLFASIITAILALSVVQVILAPFFMLASLVQRKPPSSSESEQRRS